MPSQTEPPAPAHERRLAALERRQKWLLGALGGGAGLLLLLGLNTVGSQDSIVRARQFQVLSPEGQIQARLGHAGDYGGLLSLSNARGEPRMILTLTSEGDPIMEMMSSDGEPVLRAFVREEGGRVLLLSKGRPLLSLHTSATGGGLATLGEAGKVLVDISALQDGSGALLVRTQEGRPVARLSGGGRRGSLLLLDSRTGAEIEVTPDQ